MCLLDRVIEWDRDHIVLATGTHRSPGNPLRLDGRVRAVHLCEYSAQAMAVHGGLCAQADGRGARAGHLVSLRDVTLRVDFLDDLEGELQVSATRLLETAAGWHYAFEVRHHDLTLAAGRAAIMARGRRSGSLREQVR